MISVYHFTKYKWNKLRHGYVSDKTTKTTKTTMICITTSIAVFLAVLVHPAKELDVITKLGAIAFTVCVLVVTCGWKKITTNVHKKKYRLSSTIYIKHFF